MKSFFQFLNEAQSQASMQARKLNLKSDGHGGWLDTRGKFVATTEDGKLKFLKGRPGKQEEDPKAKQQQNHSKQLLLNLPHNQKQHLKQKQRVMKVVVTHLL